MDRKKYVPFQVTPDRTVKRWDTLNAAKGMSHTAEVSLKQKHKQTKSKLVAPHLSWMRFLQKLLISVETFMVKTTRLTYLNLHWLPCFTSPTSQSVAQLQV